VAIGRRLTRIVRARRNAPEPVQDPGAALAAAQREQEDRLDHARRAVADLAVQRRRTELLAVHASDEIARLSRQAEDAVAHGDDAGARDLLRRAIVVRERRDALHARRGDLDAQVQRLERSLGQVEERVEEARLRYLSVRADQDAARAALDVRRALGDSGRDAAEAATAAREAERAARELQARAAAYDELAWTDPDAPAVRAAFEELEHGREADDELARLKQRKGIDPGR
jgi:phage shock protein A